MDPICDCQAPCHSLSRGKDRWKKTAERNMLGLWLLGFSNSLCYFITAQQFICAIAMVCQTPFTKSQCITRSWFPFITSKLLAPPLLSCSLALGVLLGGIGDGETCEENCVSNWSPLILLSWAIAESLSLGIYSTQRLRSHNPGRAFCKQGKHTRWQRLLQLLDLLRILQDECVQVSWAADLELGLGSLLVALYACSCISMSLYP